MNQNGSACLMSVDGTDFMIQEQTPFWSGWWSHKFDGPGLRYEVALCIQTGWIVWINGPFAPGPWPDISIFRDGLKKLLFLGERVEADNGSRGDFAVDAPEERCPNLLQHIAKAWCRSRHETVNKRFKQFNVLKNCFRHDIEKHMICFQAIVVVTQIALTDGGEPLFDVPYRTCN